MSHTNKSFSTTTEVCDGLLLYFDIFASQVFAVKKMDSSLFQDSSFQSFNDLVDTIANCSHPSIARLVGYCSESGHHLLVYEYFRNGSLYDFLHRSDGFSNPLTWNTRVRIALGTARAIE